MVAPLLDKTKKVLGFISLSDWNPCICMAGMFLPYSICRKRYANDCSDYIGDIINSVCRDLI